MKQSGPIFQLLDFQAKQSQFLLHSDSIQLGVSANSRQHQRILLKLHQSYFLTCSRFFVVPCPSLLIVPN